MTNPLRKIINKTLDILTWVAVEISVILGSYLMSMFITAFMLCVTMSFISLFGGSLPVQMVHSFWRYYLLWCVPAGLVIFILANIKTVKWYNT